MEIEDNERFWWLVPAAPTDQSAIAQAKARQNCLTKPAGSLGDLETVAIRFAGWQRKPLPTLERIRVCVFAADHGICAQKVSAYPQVVTTQMIQNFVDGGAAISVLAKSIAAEFDVVSLGTAHPLIDSSGVVVREIGPGTADFSRTAAMAPHECLQAMAIGRQMCLESDLFIGGEMGIGNTSSASAIFSALLNLTAEESVGRGTGLDDKALHHKIAIIDKALLFHRNQLREPFSVLQRLGGFEIAALAGAYIANAQMGVPNLIDGFISTAAALVAIRMNPSIKSWCMLAHLSAESAHQKVLEEFEDQPLLNLGMRLGEGSGAAVAVPTLRAALELHNQMATFTDAQVSEQS